MRLGLRILAVLTITFSLAPGLRADGPAKPAATARKDGSPRVAPVALAKAKPPAAASEPTPLPAAAAPQPKYADSYLPRFELFLGYSNFRAVPMGSHGNRIAWLSGGSTSLAFNANRYLGFVADFGGYHADRFGPNAPPNGGVVDASGNVFSYMFGPRLSFRHERFTPFAQALFGGIHASEVTLDGCSGIGCAPLPSENSFAMTAGGGLDVNLTPHIALRLIQAEYAMTRFRNPTSIAVGRATQNDLRLSVGIVFRFGGNHPRAHVSSPPPPPPPAEPPPNHPPTLSCSADRSSMVAGERAQITATASDPDNNPLTFSWSASGGQILGSGPSVTLDSSGMEPGTSTVTGHVDDGQGGNADCSVSLEVQAAAEAIAPVELEKALALHSIYFPTAQPTVQNPDGGLVESQQAILRTLAEDFKKYLEFKPDAHLTLEGHADERASIEYNDALAERRVAVSKSFLVEQGVPETSIETRSFGEHQQLDESQVRQQIQDNSNLTPEDRRKMVANLHSIILAQNRRVDIVLTATGQQSVRRYPFNAKDALTLLSDKALEH
jgi:outer membrane protein OmpA-like peptidoglycan-associated protein/opacity protein-like surface antigen